MCRFRKFYASGSNWDKIILEESDELRVVAGTATAVNAFASYLLSDNT